MRKSFIVFIASLLVSNIAFAAPRQQKGIMSFEKGLNSHISEWLIKDNQATESVNVRYNKTYGTVAKRGVMTAYGTLGGACTGLYRYYNSSGTQQLVAATGTNVAIGDDDAGTWTKLQNGFTDGDRWDFVTYKDLLIGANPSDQPIKYDGATTVTDNTDGARTAGNLSGELGAPLAELNTGSNLDASSWYQYKMAHYDGTTYSYSDARSNPLKTGSSVRDITLTSVPIGPTGTTHRYIYRTSGGADKATVEADTSFYLVKTLSDNTTVTFDDAMSDTTAEGDAAPTWGTVDDGNDCTPPVGGHIIIHDERLFSAGDPDALSALSYSDQFNPDFFTVTDYEEIRPDDGDEIAGLELYLGLLTVLKTNTIQKVYTKGATASDWEVSPPFSFIGCPAPYSIANTPKGLFYLGRNGLYRFTGQQSQLISDAVTPEIRDILESSISSTVGFFWNDEYQLAYTSLETGETNNNRVLVYDTIRDAYTVDQKEISAFAALNSGDDFGVLYSGSSDTDGTVYAHRFSLNILNKRLKSEFDAGTGTNVRVTGTEYDPTILLGWTITIDEASGTIDAQTGDIDRRVATGTWVSPSYQINASTLQELFWNEDLSGTGDLTVQFRAGATAGITTAFGTEFTDPSGSDLTSETANNFIQFQVNLETSDLDYSPELYASHGYVLKTTYTKQGSTFESDFDSIWTGGWNDLGSPGLEKYLQRIRVFYTGEEGTLNLQYKNARGDIDTNFDIDMTVEPPSTEEDTDNEYTGLDDLKIYSYLAPANEAGEAPIGEFWKFRISENGGDDWTVERIEVLYETVPMVV